MKINNLETNVGRYVTGTYRCGSHRERGRRDGLMKIALRDATGSCDGLIRDDHVDTALAAADSILTVQGTVARTPQGATYIRITHCAPVTVASSPSWYLLPRCWVPAHALVSFDRLLGLLDRLHSGPLGPFMEQLFADVSLAKPYLGLPASRSHHHAYTGGLLIHSVECAEAAEYLARRFLPKHECVLGVVGALLHDISKIRILPPAGGGRQAIHGVTQEALNLEVLAPFLAQLDTTWASGAAALREMLAPARPSGPSGGWSPLLLTDFIRYIDRLSAGADLRRNRFQHLPTQQRCTRTQHGQLLARVLPPVPRQSAVPMEAIV